ncbi:Uncharacterized protein PBTT_03955 [Plasmodiophora brassicae]|uniref:Uncharacterized protein n=1 Tax=Plasmodiophora brassicae TaxID=37360 RepID=A0A0G4J643_PLABS|nr:hypothetical protein PBRA_009296 [Plasmodiophora brassicae]SPQ96990.1 unnamed protein product [Plasmodiophora brassicae]
MGTRALLAASVLLVVVLLHVMARPVESVIVAGRGHPNYGDFCLRRCHYNCQARCRRAPYPGCWQRCGRVCRNNCRRWSPRRVYVPYGRRAFVARGAVGIPGGGSAVVRRDVRVVSRFN